MVFKRCLVLQRWFLGEGWSCELRHPQMAGRKCDLFFFLLLLLPPNSSKIARSLVSKSEIEPESYHLENENHQTKPQSLGSILSFSWWRPRRFTSNHVLPVTISILHWYSSDEMEIECDLTKGPRDATLGDSYWWHTLVHLTWICNKDPASEVQIVDLTIAYCFKESLSTDLQYCMYDMYAFPSSPMDIFQLQVRFSKAYRWSHKAAQQAPPTELQLVCCVFFHQALTSTKREQSVFKNPIFEENVR